MFAPRGDARNTMALAISSADTMRFSDDLPTISSRTTLASTPSALALLAMTLSMRGPATEPGQMALTRMPSAPSSIDRDLVKPITAHFDDAYGVRIGKPKRPAADDRLAMLALPLLRRCGIANCAQ